MHNLFIISTGRAASSSTYKFLDEFLELNLPDNKEPHFFLNLEGFQKKTKILKKLIIKDKTEYRKLYRHSKIIIDASVGYFYNIDDFIENFKKFKIKNNNFKVIFLYRDPISAARSRFTKEFIVGSEKKINFMQAFSRKTDKNKKIWWQYFYNNVEYHKNFIKLEKCFKQVLVINYDHLDVFIKNKETILNFFLNIGYKRKISFPSLNKSKINNYMNFKNLINFVRNKNKLKKLYILVQNLIKKIQLKILKHRIKNKNLDFVFKKSIKEYNKLNIYLKKYKILKGIYLVK